MQRPLFRKSALDRISSPEQLDQLMVVTHSKLWLALAAMLALLGVALLWSIFGRIPTDVSGAGMIVHAGGRTNVVTLVAGQVTEVHVDVGQLVRNGQVVATVDTPDAERLQVHSQHDGRVIELMVASGNLVSPGAPLIAVEFADQPLMAVVYVPGEQGKLVQPGMDVQVSPTTVQREEFGYMVGRVISVSPFPATERGMMRFLHHEGLVQQLLMAAGGSPIQVEVILIPDAHTPTGYRWSSGQGPDSEVTSGTITHASITIRDQRPISLVLPVFE